MKRKTGLGHYLEDEEIKKRIKIAAARRGISAAAYCAEAIRERLQRDGETHDADRLALLSHMDNLRKDIGPTGMTAAELVKEGRRR